MEIADIETSLSVPALIKDPIIKNATFFHLPTGGYEKFSGGFSVVFPCISNGQKWAFRCWYINGLDNIKSRYMNFSVDMHKSHLPYFCDFSYEDIGICVNGEFYPATRMKWIEGQTIKDYIVQHRYERNVLKNLAEKFYKMCEDMHKFHFAHGDLQHGNILVGNDGNLYLVDYDSFYTPSLSGVKDIIYGIPDYQHPHRVDNSFENEKLDYFSELIIYTSILAVAENPLLADEYKLKDSEKLLFSKEDYRDIQESKIYNKLMSLGGIFPALLAILNGYLLKYSINNLEPFEDLLAQNYKKIYSYKTKNRVIIVNRTIISDGLHWLLMSIEVQPTCTIFRWRVYSEEKWSYIYSDGTEYFTDKSREKKYRVFQSNGIGSSPNNPTFLRYARSTVEFFEYFPSLPSSVHTIDYYMSEENVMRNIDLTHNINSRLNQDFSNYPLQEGLSLNQIEEMAKREDVDAQLLLADMFYTGNVLPKDYSMAAKWYQRATRQANSTAEYMLGNCYYYGHGVSQSYSKAMSWYYKAAEHGNADAENDLGICYVNGDGVSQNFNEAKRWYKRAISHGSETARNNLHILMEAVK